MRFWCLYRRLIGQHGEVIRSAERFCRRLTVVPRATIEKVPKVAAFSEAFGKAEDADRCALRPPPFTDLLCALSPRVIEIANNNHLGGLEFGEPVRVFDVTYGGPGATSRRDDVLNPCIYASDPVRFAFNVPQA
jgi:hypothetical protein